jgi:hypothetical protein
MDSYNSEEDETDIESYNTWDDSDIETAENEENDFYFYDPEETSMTKYNIVLCERYNENIHGIWNDYINYYYLTHFRLKKLDNNLINLMKQRNPRMKTEIAQCIILPSQHNICILKTFWIRLVQRVWKKIYNDRKNIIKKRSNPRAIFYREISGRWPNDCVYYPYFRGMLSNLSRTSFTTS